MNQILYNKDFENEKITKNNKNKKIFKMQFFISSALVVMFVSGYFIYILNENKKEEMSKKLAYDYNISKLYSNNTNTSSFDTIYEENGVQFKVIGIIEIPSLEISYPILSESTDELLKIAPCKVSGPNPNENGNLCIAGHNYDNYKFFSKISTLNNGDEILIYDDNGNKETYNVFDMFETNANDLSPLELEDGLEKQVTLITCNNANDKRIIIKAK